jgi:hypothetical protein
MALMRTRYRVVEQYLGLKTGEVLTRSALVRARRRLNELPSGFGTVDYVPLSSGLAEVRATVSSARWCRATCSTSRVSAWRPR